jgi:predicted aldo/keto reductase-like oxidoreductase
MSKSAYLADMLQGPPQTEMEYTRLGNSGLKVSKVILGAMSYGRKEWAKWVLEESEALPLLEHAYKSGINTWDTVCLPMSSHPHQNHSKERAVGI